MSDNHILSVGHLSMRFGGIVAVNDLSFDADNVYAKLTETGVEAWAYEIIDGEHRWKAAKQLGYEKVPCWDLGPVDDETAKQLTIVLNETRGQPDDSRLKNLLDDLLKSRPQERLLDVLPFSKERFEELTQHREIDWNALQQQRDKMNEDSGDRWKELVYRMPADAAAVVERAIKTLVESEGFNHDWQALEMMAIMRGCTARS